MPPQLNSIPFPQLQSLLTPPFRNDFRFWKRRRLKRLNPNPNRLLLRNNLQSLPSDEFFSLLSSNWIPPAVLGFATAAAATAATFRRREPNNSAASDTENVTEGILFSTPTSFNRFVFLRCVSIAFDCTDRLLTEERHYVRVRVRVRVKEETETELEYERECIRTEDGGVIAIDWPVNLELREEKGMDTTVLIVPGTTEGSREECVVEFVKECLRRGLFPVVVNPRGCANSPLTTPRLFTAGDSDDICSAIQFITKARPWSTLTGVGWGYGANMLTKYLAEAGEKTPLTAATCINNPFDLDEATRISPYNAAIDKRITDGLIDILKSNKELFQGRRKGFDVEKALAAECIRDFEAAISMVSHGFESVEDFYASCSTRSMIGNLKIPVLFIQNDDGVVPLFSIPRALIAENPFTSLLLCSSVPSYVTEISLYQQVTIEWLAAVELGLLKGRHPLLQDIDVTINPSKSLALLDGRSSDTDSRLQRMLSLAEVNGLAPNVDPVEKMLTESAPAAAATTTTTSVALQDNPPPARNQGSGDYDLADSNNISPSSHSVDAGSTENTETTTEESDTGQMLQTTQVVMNMLDVTMPGTLKEEEKMKVVKAVSQGETLIKALQDAVPEDVRGKLTTSVSEILQEQGKNLNLDGLISIDQIANISSGLKSKIQEKVSKQSKTNTTPTGSSDLPSDDKSSKNDLENKNTSNQSDGANVSVGESPEAPLDKSSDIPASDLVSSHRDDAKHDGEVSKEKAGQLSESGEDGSRATAKSISSSETAGGTDSPDANITEKNSSQDHNTEKKDSEETNMPARVENSKDLTQDQDKSPDAHTRPDDTNDAPASPSAEGQQSEKGDGDTITQDEKPVQSSPDQSRVSDAKPPSFNVTQALDALTGLDDSTQMAVNSVFGVIENMITQLEEKKNDRTQKDVENIDYLNGLLLEKNRDTSEPQLEKQADGKDQEDAILPAIELDNGDDNDNNLEAASNVNNVQTNPVAITKPSKYSDNHLDEVKGQDCSVLTDIELANGNDRDNNVEAASIESNMKTNPVAVVKPGKHADVSKILSNLTTDPVTKALYKEYLHSYIISKLHNLKSFDLDGTPGLYLHYVPEEGHWILLENPSSTQDGLTHNSKDRMNFSKLAGNEAEIIEPSYVVLDTKGQTDTTEELDSKETLNYKSDPDSNLDNSTSFVKATLLNSLQVEVSRRLSATDMKDIETQLAADMEIVAEAVCLAIEQDDEKTQHAPVSRVDDDVPESSWLNKNHVVEAISNAVHDTSYLKRVLPVGVVVGSSLAALRNCCDSSTLVNGQRSRLLKLTKEHDSLTEAEYQIQLKDETEVSEVPVKGKNSDHIVGNSKKESEYQIQLKDETEVSEVPVKGKNSDHIVGNSKKEEGTGILNPVNGVNGNKDQSERSSTDNFMVGDGTTEVSEIPVEGKNPDVVNSKKEEETVAVNYVNEVNENKDQANLLSKNNLMAGAVTAAFGASALFHGQQEDFVESESNESSSNVEEMPTQKEPSKLQDSGDNKHKSNIVTSLAEKAMSVAAPVVPKKEDGEVDHDRLVATLAELGQRGGLLKLVAKVALLWGGFRGAISLTDRLLSFLRVAERPLVQRILGFVGMALVLWSPVLVPLLPTLFHNMATHSSSKIAELVCIVGLYAAVTILIMQWGKRIRGYEFPLKQYGLDLMSSTKLQDFLTGLTGGIVLVLSIHSVNAIFGFVTFSLPTDLSSSSLDLTAKFKAYGQLLLIAGRGLLMAAGVSFVEELLFRSWLLEEFAADLGYHPAIIMSGLLFALSQRSMLAIPGLWLWSLCLAGARLRKEGNLFIPIGLRTGIMASSFMLQTTGALIFQPRSQFWVAGMHPLQPFTGAVGMLTALLMAAVLYPRQNPLPGKFPRIIRESNQQ